MTREEHIKKLETDLNYFYAYTTSGQTPIPVATSPAKCKPAKLNKESDMNIATATTANIAVEAPGRREKDYLLTRLDMLTSDHRKELRKKFHMEADTPKTALEAFKMLKDGHIEFDQKRWDRITADYPEDYDFSNIYWGDWYSYIIFRNPKHKKDAEGYKKASAELDAAKLKTKDLIIIKSPEDGLAALNAFESKTFH